MSIFITSTGTDQGKTFVTTLLLQQLRAHSIRPTAIKPVISGFELGEANDTTRILAASGQADCHNLSHLDACSPWRFRAALSPDQAAEREGRPIDFDTVSRWCLAQNAMLIEGAGGLMSPLTRAHTNLDLAIALQRPVLLVSAIYLGCISHVLTALEVLKQRNLRCAGLIMTEPHPPILEATEVFASLKPQIHPDLPFFTLPHTPNFDHDWQQLPSLINVAKWH